MDDTQAPPKQQVISRGGGERTIRQRPVAFRCAWCGEPVVEQRYPGPTPAYGQACATEARRYADAAKAARRRGGSEPARVVTTSCKGSPTNLYRQDHTAEPDHVELVVRASSEATVSAALALLQAQLNLLADTTPVISPAANGGWEATLSLTLPAEQPVPQEEPPAATVEPPIKDEAEGEEPFGALYDDFDEESDEDVLAGVGSEIKSDCGSVGTLTYLIDGILKELEGGATLGVRRGKQLLERLERLVSVRRRLAIPQAVVTARSTSATAIEALAREVAIAGEISRREVERYTDQLARERGLRGQSRADVIALAQRLCDEAKALADAVGRLTVTDAAIARVVWDAWFELDEVETHKLKLPGDENNPPKERKSLPRPYDGTVVAISLNGSEKRHLTEGRFDTLCGRSIAGDWEEEKTFRRTDCKRCRQIAQKRFLVCYSCEKPLLKQDLPGLCPSCSRQEREWRGSSIYDPEPFPEEPRRSRRRKQTINDMGALFMLDQLLAQERALEQRYNLPFRAPLQTAARLHRCKRCDAPLVFLIFGERAIDVAGLDAYGRLMEPHIREHGVPTYVLGKANGEGDDAVSLFRRVWPDHGEVMEMTGNRWEQFLEDFSQSHTCRRASPS